MVLLVHGNIKRGAGSRWARKKKWKRKATNQNKTKQASDSFEHNLGVVVVDVVAVVVDGRGQADIYLRYHIWRDLSRLIFFWSCPPTAEALLYGLLQLQKKIKRDKS